MKNLTQEPKSAKSLPQWSVILKQARADMNETQEEFGKRFGVTQPTVAYWEAGMYEPPATVIMWLTERKGK